MSRQDMILSTLRPFSRAPFWSYFHKVKLVRDPGKYCKSNSNTVVMKKQQIAAHFCH